MKWWFIVANTCNISEDDFNFSKVWSTEAKIAILCFLFSCFIQLLIFGLLRANGSQFGNMFCFFCLHTLIHNHQNESKLIFYHTTSSVPFFIHQLQFVVVFPLQPCIPLDIYRIHPSKGMCGHLFGFARLRHRDVGIYQGL